MRQQKRIQGRQGLLLNEQSLQTLVETIPELVWRAKPNGHIDYVNKRLLEYLARPLRRLLVGGGCRKHIPTTSRLRCKAGSATWKPWLRTT